MLNNKYIKIKLISYTFPKKRFQLFLNTCIIQNQNFFFQFKFTHFFLTNTVNFIRN